MENCFQVSFGPFFQEHPEEHRQFTPNQRYRQEPPAVVCRPGVFSCSLPSLLEILIEIERADGDILVTRLA